MKKVVLAFAAVAALSGSASAADMAARPYTKAAAPVAYAPSWTGCYVGGGGGYGMFNQENRVFNEPGVGNPVLTRSLIGDTSTTGGRGGFGTVQAGCDYQFGLGGYNLVLGAFGDYDWSDIKGKLAVTGPNFGLVGQEKMNSAWAVGGRGGLLVTPNLLVYLSGGYTEAQFNRVNFTGLADGFIGVDQNRSFDGRTYKGTFIGTGDEYAMSFLPGLFWKTEYRASRFNTENNPFIITTTGVHGFSSVDSSKWVQTVRSELTYHFNWSGSRY